MIPSAGLRITEEAMWLQSARVNAAARIGDRVEALEQLTRKLATETPYGFRFWWGRLLDRMERGEKGVPAYDAELAAMRSAHARGFNYETLPG